MALRRIQRRKTVKRLSIPSMTPKRPPNYGTGPRRAHGSRTRGHELTSLTFLPAWDGTVYGADVTLWATARDKNPGDAAQNPGPANGTCAMASLAAWQVRRGFFTFDISLLGGARLRSAKLRIHGWKTYYAGSSFCAQRSTQASPLAVTANDYQAFTGGLLIDRFGPWDNTDWNELPFNALGRSYLQGLMDAESQYAMFCTRDYDHDYLDIEPTELAQCYCHFAAGAPDEPELVIELEDFATTTTTTSTTTTTTV